MKYNKQMRRTIENLVTKKMKSSVILNFLHTAFPDDAKPNLNVNLYLVKYSDIDHIMISIIVYTSTKTSSSDK